MKSPVELNISPGLIRHDTGPLEKRGLYIKPYCYTETDRLHPFSLSKCKRNLYFKEVISSIVIERVRTVCIKENKRN